MDMQEHFLFDGFRLTIIYSNPSLDNDGFSVLFYRHTDVVSTRLRNVVQGTNLGILFVNGTQFGFVQLSSFRVFGMDGASNRSIQYGCEHFNNLHKISGLIKRIYGNRMLCVHFNSVIMSSSLILYAY